MSNTTTNSHISIKLLSSQSQEIQYFLGGVVKWVVLVLTAREREREREIERERERGRGTDGRIF